MRRLIATLSLIAIVLFLGAMAITAVIAPTLAATYAQVDAAPISATDLIFQSRQTPVIANQSNGGGWSTVLAVLMVLAIVAGIVYMVSRGGGEALRQWRLTFKRRGHQLTHNTIPQLTETEWNLIQTARRAHNVPRLETGHETDNSIN